LGIPAPVESITAPLMVLLVSWANIAKDKNSAISATRQDFIEYSSF
jgi:hypothetical protein